MNTDYATRAAHKMIDAMATIGDGSNKIHHAMNMLGKVLNSNHGGKFPAFIGDAPDQITRMELFAHYILETHTGTPQTVEPRTVMDPDFCGDCGHDTGDHSTLSQAATHGGLGMLCQNAGCLCTHWTPGERIA